MPVHVNLRHLEANEVHLQDQLAPAQLDVDEVDELVRLQGPLEYALAVEQVGASLLVQGAIHGQLHCECARCLKPFTVDIDMDPWICNVPMEGEDQAPVVNDCVDLTPYIREDILLAFPQHPLCNADCQGLATRGNSENPPDTDRSSAWKALDKLKLDR